MNYTTTQQTYTKQQFTPKRFQKAAIIRNQKQHLLYDVVTVKDNKPVYLKQACMFEDAVVVANAYNGVKPESTNVDTCEHNNY